jgi:hypothetical protein
MTYSDECLEQLVITTYVISTEGRREAPGTVFYQ